METENKKKSSFIGIGYHFFKKDDVLRLTFEEVNYCSAEYNYCSPEHKWKLYVVTNDGSLYEIKTLDSKKALKAEMEKIISELEE